MREREGWERGLSGKKYKERKFLFREGGRDGGVGRASDEKEKVGKKGVERESLDRKREGHERES